VRKIITAAEMREIDRLTTEPFGVPSLLLMESAAGAAARAAAAQFPDGLSGKTALILCGRGNNGGDGAALARVLWTMGAKADVVLFGRVEDTAGDARINFEIARHLASFEAGSGERPSGVSFVECETVAAWEETASRRRGYDLLVDALLGTGLTRPVEGVYRKAIDHLALVREARRHAGETRPLIVSLDLPSGLDADSATPPGEAVRADLTVTFTAPKPANVLPPASHFNGQLLTSDIGSPPSLLDAAPSKLFLTEPADARDWLERTRYAPDSYKNTHGHVLVVAGSRQYAGAPALCANAAARSGAGLVTVATPASAHAAVVSHLLPEVIASALPETGRGALGDDAFAALAPLAGRATVVAVGPGLTADAEETRRFVRALVERRTTPVVIDADGLNSLAPWPGDLRGSRVLPLVLTPHEGEMRRLLGTEDRDAVSDRVRAAGEFASANGVVLLLKGARVLVAGPDGRVFVNPTGNAGLGRGGSGDTLTGVVAGFLAQSYAALKDGADAFEATVAAVYVAGLAADIAARAGGMRTLLASDVRDRLGEAMRRLDAEGETP
jgi:NAD(P)H-hydrate epimerase